MTFQDSYLNAIKSKESRIIVSFLQADDEQKLLNNVKIYLEQSKEFRVDTLSSADEGLTTPLIQSYNVRVSNYMMPGMNGVDYLKNIQYDQFIPEIILSLIITDNYLTVVWKDNGVGIAKEDKERLFERGFGKNTGLGMFLSREILSLTDTSIRETGIYGSGAQFEIKLPNGLFGNTNSESEKGIST
jgi:CheY-like chemotaxis protein